MAHKVLIYVQHLLGMGHLQRAAVIARALSEAGEDVVFVSGGKAGAGLDIAGARLEQLPPCHVADERFDPLLDEAGAPIDEAWKARRRAHLLAVLEAEAPDVILVELYPFGRRQMRFELIPFLEAATRSPKAPLILSSVRDVLSKVPDEKRQTWVGEQLERFFDGVLVHGDARFLSFQRSFPAADRLPVPLHYTGYVVARRPGPPPDPAARETGEVLVSAGGGSVGERLMEAALAARPLSALAERPWRLVTGPNLSDAAFERLRANAEDGVSVERHRRDFLDLLARCRLSISQAGYNTLLETLSLRTPAVVVPYAAGAEGEQRLRAEAFAEQGRLAVVPEDRLTPENLAAGIEDALALPSQPDLDIDLDGDWCTARLIARLARDKLGP